jgi:hypothetical protein
MTLAAYLPRGRITAAVGQFVSMVFGGLGGLAAQPVFLNAGVPVNGTSGTGAGIAPPGSLLVNTTAKTLYQNTNTLLSPTWVQFTTASGSGAFTGTFDGLVGSITPAAAIATTIVGTDTTESTGPTVAALKTAGGLGVVKTASVGLLRVDSGTKTATATTGAATLSKSSGRITTESLTTIAGATYTLTLTNTVIAAADVVLASVGYGSCTTGTPVVASILPGAGSVVIVIQNIAAAAVFNGTLIINFVVLKA